MIGADNKNNPYATDAKNAMGSQTPGASSIPANANDRPVVFTSHKSLAGGYSGIPSSQSVVNDGARTIYEAQGVLNDLRANDRSRYDAIVSKMRRAGYLGPRSTALSSIENAWTDVLKDASALYLRNPTAQNVNVFDFLDSVAAGGANQRGGGRGGSSSYGPFTNTTTTLTNQFDARYLVDDALNKYLGRDATPKERAAFWKQLNASEAANPQVDSGVTSKGGTTAVRTGGFNPQVAAEDFAKSRSDYAETQASTTILDWMNESIMKDQTEGLM